MSEQKRKKPLDPVIPQAAGTDHTHECAHEKDWGVFDAHLRNHIQPWHIVTTIVLVLASIGWLWQRGEAYQDRRIEALAQVQQAQQEVQRDQQGKVNQNNRMLKDLYQKEFGRAAP